MVVAAQNSTDEFAQAKELISQKISCANLTNDQLEKIGDYYMELMHPGEAHKYMENMMGGEGSASLKQFHINLANTYYCGNLTYRGMMGYRYANGNYPFMMGNNFVGPAFYLAGWLVILLVIIVLILLIALLIKHLKAGKKRR